MRTRVKLIAAAVAATCPRSSAFRPRSACPGDRELARGQNMMLDVSLYGESLGVFQARVDLENVQFSHPKRLAAAVPKKSADAPGLETLLRRSISSPRKRNGNLACGTNGAAPGPTILKPTVAARSTRRCQSRPVSRRRVPVVEKEGRRLRRRQRGEQKCAGDDRTSTSCRQGLSACLRAGQWFARRNEPPPGR